MLYRKHIKMCVCCKGSPVKQQDNKICVYCKNCGSFINVMRRKVNSKYRDEFRRAIAKILKDKRGNVDATKRDTDVCML